jgi:5-methylcytosine-specific restriction endonuclease McrA
MSRGPNFLIPNDSPWFICTSCNTIKPREEFNFRANGRPHQCKQCVSEYGVLYYEENKERILETSARSYERNKEKVNERSIRWTEMNKERMRELTALWYEKNKEKISKNRTRRRKEYPEKNREQSAKRRSSIADHPGFHPLLDSIIRALPCYFPGCRNLDITVDHIFPVSKGGIHEGQNIASLCGPHNFSKGKRTFEEWARGTGISAIKLEQSAYDSNEMALDILEFLTRKNEVA